jgi:hypothetical protein
MLWSSGSASSNRVALALALLVAACRGGFGGPSDGGITIPAPADDGGDALPARDCTWVVPHDCPDGGAPSYAAAVAPVIARRCLPACHEPGGASENKALTTHALIFSRRATVLNQIYTCKMPPPEKPALPVEDGDLLLTWLVCGSPNN